MIHKASGIKNVKEFSTVNEMVEAIKNEAEGPVFVSELDKFGLFDPYVGILFQTSQAVRFNDSKKESFQDRINRALWNKIIEQGKA